MWLHLLFQLPFCVVVILFQGGCCNLLGLLQAFLVKTITVLSSHMVQTEAWSYARRTSIENQVTASVPQATEASFSETRLASQGADSCLHGVLHDLRLEIMAWCGE